MTTSRVTFQHHQKTTIKIFLPVRAIPDASIGVLCPTWHARFAGGRKIDKGIRPKGWEIRPFNIFLLRFRFRSTKSGV